MVTQEHHVALVDHLVQSSRPVQRIWPIRARLAAILVAWSALGLTVASASPRPDLLVRLGQTDFAFTLVALGTASGYLTLLALRCAVPGRAPSRFELAAAAALVAMATVALTVGDARTPAGSSGWPCAVRMLAIAVAPWLILVAAVGRGAPVRIAAASIYAGAAATLLATTIQRMVCLEDDASHWLGWHLGAAVLAAMASLPIATRWLRAWRPRAPVDQLRRLAPGPNPANPINTSSCDGLNDTNP